MLQSQVCAVIWNDRHRPIAHLDPERNPDNYLVIAVDHDVVVRAHMVRKLSIVDGGDSANGAARVPVVLAGARDPLSVALDVHLTRNLVVPE